MSNSTDADLLNIFWVEVSDYLQSLNNGLLQLETGTAGDETSVLREMNRVAHSMKGAARAVGINVIETIAHYMEEIFGAALNHKMDLTPNICDLLYDGMDLIQNVVNGVENSTEALAAVLARLEQTIVGAAPEAAKTIPKLSPTQEVKRLKATPTVSGTMELGETGTLLMRPAEDGVRVPVSKLDRLNGEISELLVTKMHGEERQRDILRLQKLHHRWQREWRSVRTTYIRLARRLQNSQHHENVDELDALLKFLETNQRYLTEANRHLAQISRDMGQYNSQIGTLIEQLQDDVSRMRLVPFETGLSGFQRMVRDLARDTDKNIYLDIIGATVELDKTTLDALKEPIMHLLRNAIDHGIEPSAERERLGKPNAGILIMCFEERGLVIL
ncbi:MAG TPA: Hpt domain-containing protein, partial [Phototrophicaceae bacterium]|nr:Hpt domain-containing protein [Phototrophicaceae bacterium]